MLPQFDNRLMSSFLLWFDHNLTRRGEAFTNTSGAFYAVDNLINGYYTYGAPFKQFVSDFSVTGTGNLYPNKASTKHANIPTGVYLSGVFTPIGTNGLSGINYDQGQIYMTYEVENPDTSISGDYAVKDFNVYLTNEPEEKLLFETKFNLTPKTNETQTGLASNQITYPAIFLRHNGSRNEPFAFGGYDSTTFNIRAIVLADSQFNLDAVCSIFRDVSRTHVTLLQTSDMPYNSLGSFKSGNNYSYTGLIKGKSDEDQYVFIDEVNIAKFSRDVNLKVENMNPDVFNGVIDFEISKPRYPRKATQGEDIQ
tara:strand:+ start:209 stop:1138 length:930 start_codon:yes stop_codon:yes gene_type:complete